MPGIAGFHSRPVRDDDLLVCSCGVTLGTQKLIKNPDQLLYVTESHAAEHKERLTIQAASRGYEPPVEERVAE